MTFGRTSRAGLPQQQRGLALVMVLWLVVLLSAIAGGHAYNAHTETRLAALGIQTAKARAAVESGLSLAILRLLANDDQDLLPIDGTVVELPFNGARIRIAVRDATGLIDLNSAGPELFQSLTASLNVGEEQQARIAAAILDWRDSDDSTRTGGAETADYLTADHPWTPRNGAFSSVEELRYVIGVTPRLFEEMAPFVTVYSERAGINLEFAAPFLINALTGHGPVPTANQRPGRDAQTAANRGSGTYHIYLSSQNDEGIGASAEAVVRLTDDAARSYRLLYWRESMRTGFPAAGHSKTQAPEWTES